MLKRRRAGDIRWRRELVSTPFSDAWDEKLLRMVARVAERGERCLRHRLLRYGSSGAAETLHGTGWTAVATGVRSNDMNGVVGTGGSVQPSDVAGLVAWFRDRDLPASWLTVSSSPELSALLVGAGALPERSGWWMGRTLDVAPESIEPASVDICRVSTEGDLDDWLAVAAACGWIDDDVDRAARRRLYLGVGLDDAQLRHWIARHDGAPVGMASAWVDGDTLDLCNLAVLDAFRRKGIGRALVAHRVRDAVRLGASTALIAPSPDGARLYRQLGYDTVAVIPDTCFYLP